MKAVVFRGPSIPLDEAESIFDATYLPPAAQGDIYRAASSEPDAIGIIDGRFQDVPAVWHKEILWALHRGIPVYGAASMGALRAAETATFGTHGVGRVYEAYAAGELEDDDEVAVAHGGPEVDFQALSDALVDIRATLARARTAGVVGGRDEGALVAAAKSMYFAHRSYEALLRQAPAKGVDSRVLDALSAWLPANTVHQKRDDARQMLRLMASDATREVGPSAAFEFEHTQFFERARRTAPPSPPTVGGARLDLDAVVGELRVHTERYLATRQGALMRYLALREARQAGWDSVTDADLDAELGQFCSRRGLMDPLALSRFLRANDLSLNQFRALLREEVLVGRVWATMRAELELYMRNQLQIDGGYPGIARRAMDKAARLAEADIDPSDPAEGSEHEILAAFFENVPLPERAAAADEYAAAVDVGSRGELIRLLRAEYCFRRLTGAPPTAPQASVGPQAPDQH